MASFDIMAATKAGYRYVLDERMFILRLAMIPIFVKFICYFSIISLGLETNILRQGLVLFPAFLLEGYLVCTLLRMGVFTHEAIIQPPGAASFEYYRQRGRDIQAGAVIYTLLKLIASLLLGVLIEVLRVYKLPEGGAALEGALQESALDVSNAASEAPPGSFEQFFLGALFFISALWAFRLIWIYVPVSLGYTLREYMTKIRGFSFSFHIFAVWLMCLVPTGLIILVTSDITIGLTGHSLEAPSYAYKIFMIGVQCILETIAIIIASVAIGHGILAVLSGRIVPGSNNNRKAP